MMKLLDRAEVRRPSPKVGEHTTGLRPWLVAWLGLPVLGVANGALRDATYKRPPAS